MKVVVIGARDVVETEDTDTGDSESEEHDNWPTVSVDAEANVAVSTVDIGVPLDGITDVCEAGWA